jgi:hypothetical protein
MTIFNYGKQDHLSVDADFTTGDTFIVGNGNYDFVSNAQGILNVIKLGNGAGDQVNSLGTTSDTITLGNGGGDTVLDEGVSNNITLGNGHGDYVGT